MWPLFFLALQDAPRVHATVRDPLECHQRGLSALQKGALEVAERAFSELIDLAPLPAPAPSGPALPPDFQNQRALFVPELSLAAAYNNRGAVRLLRGNLSGAVADLDRAAQLQPEWAPPWTNGALLWLERNNAQKAMETAITARSYGGETPQTLTVLAEGAILRQQWDSARAALRQAGELAPSYPYALVARALLEEAQGRGREAERFRMQALALLPQTATSGKSLDGKRENQLSLGTNEHIDARSVTQQARRETYSSTNARFVRQAVEGRADARQNLLQLQALSGKVRSTGGEGLLFRLVGESGQFPGEQGGAAAQRTQGWGTVGLLRRHEGANGRWIGALTLRSNQLPSLSDRQLGAELRWDGRSTKALGLTGGLALMQNTRTGFQPRGESGFPAPSEPSDQLLAPGTTHLVSAYVLVSRQKQPDRLWRAGAVLGWSQSALASLPTRAAYGGLLADAKRSHAALLPYLEWRQPLQAHQHLHAVLRPRLHPAQGELMAANLLLDPLFTVPGIPFGSTNRDRLPDFFLHGPEGQRWDSELSFRENRASLSWEAALFRRELRNGFVLTGDPRLAGALPLRAVSSARTTGVSLLGRRPLGRVAWVGSVRYQQSGTLGLPMLDLCLRAEQLASTRLGAPYAQVHHWQASSSGYTPGGLAGRFSSLTLLELGGQRASAPYWESFWRVQLPLGSSRGFFPGYPLAAQLLVGVRQRL